MRSSRLLHSGLREISGCVWWSISGSCLALLTTIIIPFFQTSDQARFLRLFTNLLSRGNSDLNEDKILIGRLFTSLEQLRTDRRAGTVEARTSPSQALRGGEKNKHQQEQNAIHDHWASSQHSHQHTEVSGAIFHLHLRSACLST